MAFSKGSIFCSDCAHYEWSGNDGGHCAAPLNFAPSYLKENGGHINSPKCINKNNDCEWFVPSDSSECFGCLIPLIVCVILSFLLAYIY